jgi:hypothetical protein
MTLIGAFAAQNEMLADVRVGSFSTESGGSRDVRFTPDSKGSA